jgi:hypothetical protein
MTTTLPTWAAAILNAIQPRGNGLHSSIFRAAIALRRCGWNESDIYHAIDVATAGQPLQPREIDEAVARSKQYMSNRGRASSPPSAKWPAFDAKARQKIIDDAAGFCAADLWEASPVRFDDDAPHTDEIINALFPPGCLVCVGRTLIDATTAPRGVLQQLSDRQFIVPSPMAKPIGKTQEGKDSARCLDNTGPRRYLVIEMDKGTADEQAAILAHLTKIAPLVLAVRSAGKSIHGWFRCEGADAETVRRFFAVAVRIGADPIIWTPCQFVRIPDGTRRWPDGRTARQFVLYYAPDVARGQHAGN